MQVVLGGVDLEKLEPEDQAVAVERYIMHENYTEIDDVQYNDIGPVHYNEIGSNTFEYTYCNFNTVKCLVIFVTDLFKL